MVFDGDQACACQFVPHGIKRSSADIEFFKQIFPFVRSDRISGFLAVFDHIQKLPAADSRRLFLEKTSHEHVIRITGTADA